MLILNIYDSFDDIMGDQITIEDDLAYNYISYEEKELPFVLNIDLNDFEKHDRKLFNILSSFSKSVLKSKKNVYFLKLNEIINFYNRPNQNGWSCFNRKTASLDYSKSF